MKTKENVLEIEGWICSKCGEVYANDTCTCEKFNHDDKRILLTEKKKTEKLTREECEKEIKRLRTTTLQGAKIIKTSMDNLKEVRRLQNKLSRIAKEVEAMFELEKKRYVNRSKIRQYMIKIIHDEFKKIMKGEVKITNIKEVIK